MVSGAFRAAAEWSDDRLRRGDFQNFAFLAKNAVVVFITPLFSIEML